MGLEWTRGLMNMGFVLWLSIVGSTATVLLGALCIVPVDFCTPSGRIKGIVLVCVGLPLFFVFALLQRLRYVSPYAKSEYLRC